MIRRLDASNQINRNAVGESSSSCCNNGAALKFKTIAYVALVVQIVWLIVNPIPQAISSTYEKAVSSVVLLGSSMANTTYSNNYNDCHARLDALEQAWDERQKVRVDVLENDETRRNNYAKNPKWNFDPFEPEAECLTMPLETDPNFTTAKEEKQHEQQQQEEESASSSSFLLPCLVYSIGSNNDVKFERSIKAHVGCEIHTFDPTLKSPFVGGEYAVFHPWGLGEDNVTVPVGGINFTTMNLEHMMKELGHTKRKIDIFKIDCEGCEWKAMPPVFEAVANGTMEIDQILIELHRPPIFYDMIAFFAAADMAGFRVTHKERNGWGCDGHRCVEYAFTQASFLRRVTEAAICY